MSGSGYSGQSGCVSIYENTKDPYKGLEGPSAAERATMLEADSGKFYDLLSATDREKLSQKVKVKTGEYNWGIIETHPWAKIKAKTGSLCTLKDGGKEETLPVVMGIRVTIRRLIA